MRYPPLLLLLAALLCGCDQNLSVNLQFEHADGLTKGTVVRANGTPVGAVTRVTLSPEGAVLATAAIDRSAAQGIPEDSVAILAPGGVDLELGSAKERIRAGSTLQGYPSRSEMHLGDARKSLEELLYKAREGADELQRSLEEKGAEAAEELQRRLEELKEKLDKALPSKEKPEAPQAI